MGCSPQGRKELDTTKRLDFHFHFHFKELDITHVAARSLHVTIKTEDPHAATKHSQVNK